MFRLNSIFLYVSCVSILFCFACAKEEQCETVDSIPDIIYVEVGYNKETVCLFEGKSVNIDAFRSSAIGYLWTPTGDTTSSITVTAEGEYQVEVFYDSSSYTYKSVEVGFCNGLHVPNAFTPNSDGYNDVFMPFLAGISCYFMEIRNEDGILVFKTNDVYEGWDGIFNDGKRKGKKVLPQGSYSYYIEFSYPNSGQQSIHSGRVVLMK